MRSLVPVLAAVALGGCVLDEIRGLQHGLTAAERRARAALIRDAAAEMGVHNAALIGGIAVSESGLAHCWAEATWACMGPYSTSCDGPIIAGAYDGPCADMQGGLGMFQFDAGTHDQTLEAYGPAILTVEGNTAQAVAFVIARLRQELPDVNDWLAAAAYLNGVPLVAGDPTMEQWAQFLACRYNGCCSGSATCTTRAARYRDHAIALHAELGAAFWSTAQRCAGFPEPTADGRIIEPRSACYLAGGDPRFWRREDTGHGGAHEWTRTTTSPSPANFARWLLRPGRPRLVRLDAYISGGEATAAVYEIAHAGQVERVTIDQTAVDGFVTLGELELAGDGDEYVQLADNTGTTGERLVFGALRVVPLDDDDPPDDGAPQGCGCAAGDDGGGGAGGAAGALAAALAIALTRRARPARTRTRTACAP